MVESGFVERADAFRAILPGADTLSGWDRLLGTPLLIVVTLVGAVILRWVLHRVIARTVVAATSRSAARIPVLPGRAGRALAEAAGLAHQRHVQRTTTMGSLLRSITTFVVYGIAVLTMMSLVGLPLGPLLASAGVGGVALGFGAQSLVKDFLSGIFMIVEDQYGVGDLVDTGEVVGTVEEVSLRVTRIRDWTGIVWYVRNGEILRIGNRSQGWSMAIVDIPVGSRDDVPRAIEVIGSSLASMASEQPWADDLVEAPTVAGVESVAAGIATIRVLAKCAPTRNVGVQREMRERVLAGFAEAGLKLPVTVVLPPPPA
ncbi:MAG: mechanosensitive ion channel family protein [Actinomycetota bacterium]|nr:mechanosensitive ion channel family protein [Actinomycetota bacterium]